MDEITTKMLKMLALRVKVYHSAETMDKTEREAKMLSALNTICLAAPDEFPCLDEVIQAADILESKEKDTPKARKQLNKNITKLIVWSQHK